MACGNCGCGTENKPAGCGSKGYCISGCNKLSTLDWIEVMEIPTEIKSNVVEVSFKNGASKDFFLNPNYTRAEVGDMVIVERSSGYDVGQITLGKRLTLVQIKKKNIPPGSVYQKVIRIANKRDLEKYREARKLEKPAMIKARVISRSLGLEMKIGDVEYQGDLRKATFYYTANGRVDFRELVKQYAKEFKIRVEMRQIGARQESGRIGGIGSCGRELCCSTWLTNFNSVSTSAAKYQNLSINQAKLSGQCGRLKCCLNYELETYVEALKKFPQNTPVLVTKEGKATFVKSDIFKDLMYYSYEGSGRPLVIGLTAKTVRRVMKLNEQGKKPDSLEDESLKAEKEKDDSPADIGFK